MSSHGQDQKATQTEFDGAPVPLRTWESDSSRDAQRQSVQKRVLASGLQVQGLHAGSQGEIESKLVCSRAQRRGAGAAPPGALTGPRSNNLS